MPRCEDSLCPLDGEHEMHEPERSRRRAVNLHRALADCLRALAHFGGHRGTCEGSPVCSCGLAAAKATYQGVLDAPW